MVSRANAEPSPQWREGVESRRRAPTVREPDIALADQGEGVLQTTNAPARRRKPKWYENPWTARSCRFESGLGHHPQLVSLAAVKIAATSASFKIR